MSRDMGATIIDALDTLLIMGLKDHAQEAEDFLFNSLDLNKVGGLDLRSHATFLSCLRVRH